MCSSISDNFREELSVLIPIIFQEDNSHINEDLRRFAGTISPRAAFYLLSSALRHDLPLKTFETILEHSPPVPELFSDDNPAIVIFRNSIALIANAAIENRADALALLLERGASPNRVSFCLSPLEEALRYGSLESLEILLRHPGLDTTWTDQLRLEWAAAECAEPRQQQCLRAMAPRFTGREAPPDRPLPIPEAMTAHIIAIAENWSLLERFCRERGRVSPEDGQRAFGQMTYIAAIAGHLEEEEKVEDRSARAAAALAVFLESCPELLGPVENCRTLLRCFLESGEAAQKHLRPCMERIGPNAVIDRWSDVLNSCRLTVGVLGNILDVCPIGGTGRTGELSPLARTVLRRGNLALVLPLLRQSGSLLATEDPDALLEYVLEGSCLGADGERNGFMAEKRKAMSSAAPAARTPEQTRSLAARLLSMQSICSHKKGDHAHHIYGI